MERAVTLAPADDRIRHGYLNVLFTRALRLLVRGNADMARQMLSYAIANGLDATATRLWRARAFRALGRLNEALADCEAALRHSPNDASIRWVHAGILLAAGRQAEAVAEFETIRADNPDLPSLPQDDRSLARLRASVAFRDGRWKEAASQSLALLRGEPKDAALRALAAESLRALADSAFSRPLAPSRRGRPKISRNRARARLWHSGISASTRMPFPPWNGPAAWARSPARPTITRPYAARDWERTAKPCSRGSRLSCTAVQREEKEPILDSCSRWAKPCTVRAAPTSLRAGSRKSSPWFPSTSFPFSTEYPSRSPSAKPRPFPMHTEPILSVIPTMPSFAANSSISS